MGQSQYFYLCTPARGFVHTGGLLVGLDAIIVENIVIQ